MDWNYITERVNRYNQSPSDDLLYRIGTHVDVLSPKDCNLMKQAGNLHPEQRYRVLNWMAKAGLEIKGDLALLIFGRKQLEEWLEISRQAYPDFEFYLVFEFQERHKTGWEEGINFTMHWSPKVGAPEPSVECDFPWKSYWECGGMFWDADWTNNQFDQGLGYYPNQWSFATPNSLCEEGDRYTMLDDRDADLMSVAQVLEHFAVPA